MHVVGNGDEQSCFVIVETWRTQQEVLEDGEVCDEIVGGFACAAYLFKINDAFRGMGSPPIQPA